MTHFISLPVCFRRPLALFVLALAALGLAAPAARALTSDELLPANLVGKTLTFTHTAPTANTLDGTTTFTVQFTSATTYVHSGGGVTTEGGVYSAVSSVLTPIVDVRTTTLLFSNNWLAPGSTVAVVMSLSNANATGSYVVAELLNASKASVGSFGVNGSTSGGGGPTTAPVITSPTTATATVGSTFTYQITATPAATSYTNAGGNAPIQINTSTGLVTGSFPSAGTYTFSYTAANAIGGTKPTVVTVTVTGGATGAPVITGSTQLTASVGVPFSYQITTSPAATSYGLTGNTGGFALTFSTGNVDGPGPGRTFSTAGTYTFTVTATNSAGTSAPTTFTVVVTNGIPGNVSAYAGTYTGAILVSNNGAAEITFTTYSAVVSATGALVAQGGELTGTVNASGVVTFNSNGLALTTGSIVNQRLNATGGPSVLGTVTRIYRLVGSGYSGSGGATNLAVAPVNLVGYRNKVGSVYQFAVTGSASGAIWGTDVYTDDSAVATAAVHAGVLAVGETKTVTVTILPGQAGYTASTRNNIKASSWGAWSGSYSFAGTGAVVGTSVATARPVLAPGYAFGATSYAAGGRLVLPISVVGGGTYSYQWYFNNVLISGATSNPYIIDTLTTANAGTYTVDVTNALGTSRLTAGTITVGATGSPTLALQPISKTVVPGATFTLATNATGSGLTYQWFRNNVSLPGETGAILLRNNASTADAGSYSVRVSNSSGTVTSNAATVTLSANASRPANISVRTNVASGALVTPGFVIQGTGSKRVLIRAVGPGLAAFGLGGTMADPKFTVFQGSTKIAENDDWSATNVGTAFTATGAFALTAGSKDAALVTDLAAGKDYTVQVTNASGNGGIVLIEVYDADALKGTSTSKLVNVSVRGQTAPGDDVLTLGLVIGGSGPRTLLVRGVGPKLATFGVTGTLPDPRLQIIDSQGRAILANDDWGSADFVSELALASDYVGAFALDAGSKDAATLSLVDPGAYTIQVSGTATAPTGEALVEVYEVP